MIKNEKPLLTEKERIALAMNQDGKGLIMDLKGTTAEDVLRENAINKANAEYEKYAEAFGDHTEKLKEAVDNLSLKAEDIEIMPIGNYLLVKEFPTNPFQRIVKQGNIITDLGGQAPIFTNTETGELQEEEEVIKVGVIIEKGPECKWCKETDTIFYTKPSAVPVPFYKQNLQLVCENRVLAVVNEKLKERFENGK